MGALVGKRDVGGEVYSLRLGGQDTITLALLKHGGVAAFVLF